MADHATAPKDYYGKMVSLGAEQFPYGADCKLARDVQAAAFHHGLSQASVDVLIHFEFDTALSFSMANPDGDEDQKAVFRLSTAGIDSPLARSKVL